MKAEVSSAGAEGLKRGYVVTACMAQVWQRMQPLWAAVLRGDTGSPAYRLTADALCLITQCLLSHAMQK